MNRKSTWLTLAGLLLTGLTLAASFYWAGIERVPAGITATIAATDCKVPAGNSGHAGMVWIGGGAFTMGAEYAYPEEGPAHPEQVSGFWMDQTEVTNAQFAQFVDATGYLTLAERGIKSLEPGAPAIAGSAVFKPVVINGELDPFANWWHFIESANWRNPQGPGSSITGLEQHPVVHIAFEDAHAYAQWKGHSLPTEAQFEFAAQTSAREDAEGAFASNTWQGFFPYQDDSLDGFASTAPVGCYAANALGVFDLIGNVWEWTASPYYQTHDFTEKNAFPEGFDPNQPDDAVAVIKGGSWLCAPNYCMRYRPEARQGQSKGLGTSHIGFRTVLNP